MIDFRYHLVSLVSVFLALAVGIVLGAGPLKGEIGDKLTTQVQNLRNEANDLRTQVKTAQGAVDNRDTFTRAVLPQLVSQQLTGRQIAVVTVPGIDNDTVKPLTDTLRAAGASVTGRVDLNEAWVDPERASDRDTVVRRLNAVAASSSAASSSAAAVLGTYGVDPVPPTLAVTPTATTSPAPTVPGAIGTDSALAALLAGALVTRDLTKVGHADRGTTQLLDTLTKAGLVTVNGEVTGRATEAVLLVPAVPNDGADAVPTTPPSIDPVAQWSALAVALDSAGDGAVVTGPGSSATNGGVVAAIRGQDALAKLVSTVDTGGTPMGDLTTVLALREQASGGSGRYGFVGKVDGPLPSRAGAKAP